MKNRFLALHELKNAVTRHGAAGEANKAVAHEQRLNQKEPTLTTAEESYR